MNKSHQNFSMSSLTGQTLSYERHAPMQTTPRFRGYRFPGNGAAGNPDLRNNSQKDKMKAQPVDTKLQLEKGRRDARMDLGSKSTDLTIHNTNVIPRPLPPSIRIDDTSDHKSTPNSSFTSASESNGNDSGSSPPSSPNSLPRNHFSKRKTLATLLDDYDLAAPMDDGTKLESLEIVSDLLFSVEHLRAIFDDPSSLLKFTQYLVAHRPKSVPVLIYYLDATKALQAIAYANAISKALESISKDGLTPISMMTSNSELKEKAEKAFNLMVQYDLPAYVTYMYIEVVRSRIRRPATMTQPSHLSESSSGFAEVFCLTDPSRPDNPIVFASKAFYYMTQYSMRYTIGKNCRFLQGPKTSQSSLQRIRDSVKAGREHCEVILNYRRDGSPFLNLLMHAPLYDHLGKVRYFMGAQIDVGNILDDDVELESLRRVIAQDNRQSQHEGPTKAVTDQGKEHAIQQLFEMLDVKESKIIRELIVQEQQDFLEDEGQQDETPLPGLGVQLRKHLSETTKNSQHHHDQGTLLGLYNNYLLIRPFPSLHVLFASPSLSKPGILQSPVLDLIGGSTRVRDELRNALAEGREVTAKIRWISPGKEEDQNRWIHFTPLIGTKDQIGVWMAVLEDNEPISDGLITDAQSSILPMNQTSHVKANYALAESIPEESSDIEEETRPRSSKANSESHRHIMGSVPEVTRDFRKASLDQDGRERQRSLDWNREDGKPSIDLRRKVPGSPRTERSLDSLPMEIGEEYESLEERLRKKRQRDAMVMMDQPGAPFRRTYKSLAPVTTESVMNDE